MVDYRTRHADLHADFATPDPAFSPAPIWWWSGAKVTLAGLREQLDTLVEQGVHNVVVINLAPSGPSYGALADEPALLSDDWWDLWTGLCAHARDRGARLWFYDQIGFSGANLQGRIVAARPEFAGASLEYLTGRGELRVPDGGEAIAAWAVDERRPLSVHSGRVSHDGEILLAYQLRRGFDYTSRQACAVLFDQVHGEFERRLAGYLGDVVVGSFQDELPSLPTWSPRFSEEFAKRCGYRIETLIGALWHDWGPESARVRVDYQRVRAALAEEAFFAPLHEWHERHGMTVGVDQQSPSRAGEPLGTVRQYADYPRTHRWYSAPGSDHWGDAKLHSSLAHHYGRPRTWIEAFHSTGWGGTLEETFDWLLPWLTSGATLYNPHAVYYSTGQDWWEWAPPSTCWRQPYWPHYRHFADTVARLCKLLTRGEHVCDVGVLFPATTVAAGTLVDGTRADAALAHRTYLDVVGRMLWFDTTPGVLRSAGLDFDVLDDHTVATASVRDGALHTRGERYRVVVVPACTVLEAATARRLVELAANGGQVVLLGALPEHADTPDGDDAVARLRELGVTELPSLDRPVRADTPVLRRRVGDREVLLVTAGEATVNPILPGTAWSDEAEDLDMPRYNRLLRERGYAFDPSRRASSTTVWLAGMVTDVEQWDPLTGTASPAPCRAVDGGTEVTVTFDSAPAAVLVWSDEVGSPVAVEPPPVLTPVPLTGPWRSTVDASVVAQSRPWHRIDGEWRRVLVTYGEFAQVSVDGGPWRPVEYSLSRGIEKDPVHVHALGPKGRVPEEFWHVEGASTVRLRTTLPTPPGARTLAVAANGPVEVWWNGTRLLDDPGGHLRLYDVECVDRNGLEVVVRSEEDGPLRGYWALTDDPVAFARPEWLTPADGSVPGTTVRATATVVAAAGPVVVQLGTEGAATFLVNGAEVAVQGAFDPYATRPNPRVLPHEIALVAGENRLEVVFRDMGAPVSLIFDGLAATWSFTRDGAPVATALRRRQSYDGRWPLSRARPHPLPRATWLDGAPVTGVLDVVPDSGHERREEWFRLVVPPGARRVRLPIAGEREAWVDGAPLTGEELPPGRELLIKVTPVDGRTGGALWNGPAEFEMEPNESPIRAAQGSPDVHAISEDRPKMGFGAVGSGESPVHAASPNESPIRAAQGSPGFDATAEIRRGTGVSAASPSESPVRAGQGAPDVHATSGDRQKSASGGGVVDRSAIEVGPWEDAGLGSFSGAVSYHRDLELSDPATVILDLGTVRGTAEVHVNGRPAGVRIWSPYRFDLTGLVRDGTNTITVTVRNTLGPRLDDTSPTLGVYAGQRVSGMLGPVTLWT